VIAEIGLLAQKGQFQVVAVAPAHPIHVPCGAGQCGWQGGKQRQRHDAHQSLGFHFFLPSGQKNFAPGYGLETHILGGEE
jgi:hypothetical protein